MEKWIAKQMLEKYRKYHKLKSVPHAQRDATFSRAELIVKTARRNGTLRVLEKNGKYLAVIGRVPVVTPRIQGQQSLFFVTDSKFSSKVRSWLVQNLAQLAIQAPRYSEIKMSEKEALFLGTKLQKAGFQTRFDVLQGQTKTALKNLLAKKSPPSSLDHLGLEIRPITSIRSLPEVMKLQKIVSRGARRHVYFASSARQLREDRNEYRSILKDKSGLLLGVYRGKRLLGFMLASLHGVPGSRRKTGGFSFFLHPSIQGIGVTKTGYRLMLEYLLKNKAFTFHGGTSQPAILSLGKIMRRKIMQVIYVKMV